jgi:hypothetical protein
LSIPKKSIHEVVSAVKAESVVAKVAAVKPNKKIIDGISAKWFISGKANRFWAFQ